MITFHRCYGYNKVMYCCYLTQDWPEVPTDCDEWSPPRKKLGLENFKLPWRKRGKWYFHAYVHIVVMDITKWCFVVITYRITCGYVCNCFMVRGMYILVFMCIYVMKDWYVHNICFFHTVQLWLLVNVVMDITKWCIVVITHRIICGCYDYFSMLLWI